MRLLAAIAVWLAVALPATAQDSRPQVLIIEGDRLYEETLYGRRLQAELLALQSEFQAELDANAEKLRNEERSLTLRRPEMTREAFRLEAEAFDAKAQEARRTRTAKIRELQSIEFSVNAEFKSRVEGIVADLMFERGAVMVVERDTVVVFDRRANITDELIVRINSRLRDGTR